MALINIEYGSLASSETMNSNFQYLDDKISEVSSSLTTSISSVSSNIATVNANLSDLSDTLDSTKEELEGSIEDAIEEANSSVLTAVMLPNWAGCITISKPESYKVPSNGYILLNPVASSSGDLTVNNTTVKYKLRGLADDNAAQLVPFPVKKGDTVTCTSTMQAAYFLPVVSSIS